MAVQVGTCVLNAMLIKTAVTLLEFELILYDADCNMKGRNTSGRLGTSKTNCGQQSFFSAGTRQYTSSSECMCWHGVLVCAGKSTYASY